MESRRHPKSSRRRVRRSPSRAPGSSGASPEKRSGLPRSPEQSTGLTRRRSLRSPRPDSQFNLRRLLGEPAATGRSERKPSEKKGAALAPTHPRHGSNGSAIRPAPKRASSSQIIPLQARPVQDRTASPSHQPRRRRRRAQPPPPPLVYLTRLLIFGVGVGAIAGTILSIWTPVRSPLASESEPTTEATVANTTPAEPLFRADSAPPTGLSTSLSARLGQPITALTTDLQALIRTVPDMTVGVFIVDLDSGDYVDINGSTSLSAASTIKVPILVSFLQDVDAGRVQLDDTLILQATDVADGSGEFQYLEPGTTFSTMETATKMITISDNTATNMILRQIGGAEPFNQRVQTWGMGQTVLRNPLADLEGTNTTSARDLSLLLMGVAQGEMLSLRSRDRLLEIMQATVTNSMLPAGLSSPDAVIAHKTGTIDMMVGDTGIVDLPNGKRYVITALVQRPLDDLRAQDLVRQISQQTEVFFTRPVANPSTSSTPLNTAPVTPNPAQSVQPSQAVDSRSNTQP
ncbi:MAG: serine hydrolase [Cyanobacteria bacterium J06638_20]